MTRWRLPVISLTVAGVFAGGVCAGGDARHAYAQQLRAWTVKLEAGTEYDSNVRHEIAPQLAKGSAGLRLGARAQGRATIARHHRLQILGLGGARWFVDDDAASEDVVAWATRARYDIGIPSRSVLVRFAASHHSTFGGEQTRSPRNFSDSDVGGAAVLVGPDNQQLAARVGWRRFRFRPNPQWHWNGPSLGIRYRAAKWRDDGSNAALIELEGSYRVERRRYQSDALVNRCDPDESQTLKCYDDPTEILRADLHHVATASVSYTGDRIYGLRYQARVNNSNSAGGSFAGHRVDVTVTAELWGAVFVTANGTLLYDAFSGPLVLSPGVVSPQGAVTLDDDNLSGVTLHAARRVGERWSAEARYGLFSDRLGIHQRGYWRQTAYLGLVYAYDHRDMTKGN